MDGQPVALRLSGLSKAEHVELAEQVDERYLLVEREPVPEGAHGELVTLTVVIVLTAAALKGFASYLALRHRGKSFAEELEVVLPDGTTVTRWIKWQDSSGEPLDAAVVRELSTIPGAAAALQS